MSGCELVRFLINALNVDIEINITKESFNGTYDPTNKKINLSDDICKSKSLSAVSVTAHEVGHLIQDIENYKLLNYLILFYPLADFGASMSWIMILIGMVFESMSLIYLIGVSLLILAFFYQLLQIPLEFDASKRAIRILVQYKLITKEELDKLTEMLDFAALSFLATPADLFFTIINSIRRGS